MLIEGLKQADDDLVDVNSEEVLPERERLTSKVTL